MMELTMLTGYKEYGNQLKALRKLLNEETEFKKIYDLLDGLIKIDPIPVSWGEINLQRADKYKAIVNPEIGKVYSIVSKDYKLIRHEDAVNQIENALDKHPGLKNHRVRTEFYNHGARMRRNYCFYEIFTEIEPGDSVNPELHVFNSYDTTWPFIVLIGAFRFVCANGLVVGEKYFHLRKRHVYHFDEMDIKEQVSTALKRFKLQTNQWKKWTSRQLTEKTYEVRPESHGGN